MRSGEKGKEEEEGREDVKVGVTNAADRYTRHTCNALTTSPAADTTNL